MTKYSTAAPPLDLNAVILALIDEKTAPLMRRISQLEALQSEWVDTKEAKKMTNIRRAATLKAERERPGTLLIVKMGGINNTTPYYLRKSLVDYNDSKRPRRIINRVFA